MCGFESERGKLKFDAPMNWQSVEFSKCVDRRQMHPHTKNEVSRSRLAEVRDEQDRQTDRRN